MFKKGFPDVTKVVKFRALSQGLSQGLQAAKSKTSAWHSSQQIQGRRQAVRQQVLILPCVGSNPAAPAIFSSCSIRKHSTDGCYSSIRRFFALVVHVPDAPLQTSVQPRLADVLCARLMKIF